MVSLKINVTDSFIVISTIKSLTFGYFILDILYWYLYYTDCYVGN